MRNKFTMLALVLLVTSVSGCSSPWTHLQSDSSGWFQNRHTLYYCRVTAFDGRGLPVPMCVRAGTAKLSALMKPYTWVKPTVNEGL